MHVNLREKGAKRGGRTGSGGKDDGDGAGVWLFGMSWPQACTPSENPCIPPPLTCAGSPD
jgi:hypothetical protein